MKRKHEMFWNNNYEWLNTWYGIRTDSNRYRGYDFVEANGRVFFKAKLSTIYGEKEQNFSSLKNYLSNENHHNIQMTSKDWLIGFVKPMSDKLTILDVIPDKTLAINGPSISLSRSHIYWIVEQKRVSDGMELLVANASVKYSDKYKIDHQWLKVENIASETIIQMVLVPHDSVGCERTFLFAKQHGQISKILALDNDGNCIEICEYDVLLGYNENYIYIRYMGDIQRINRSDTSLLSISNLSSEITSLVHGDNQMADNFADEIAYVDAARDELFLYEKKSTKHPGECALIGVPLHMNALEKPTVKERVSCPEVVANRENPLIFDGYKYVWRINSLWKGYKVYRKDGSLQEQFLVNHCCETKNSPVVFTSPTVIFIEWNSNPDDSLGDCLSYSTNKGLCQMFRLDNHSECKTIFQEEAEDRELYR